MNNPTVPDVLSLGKILQKVENKRIPANPATRRTFNDDEIDRLIEVCKEDKLMSLAITILQEIGLRISALCTYEGNIGHLIVGFSFTINQPSTFSVHKRSIMLVGNL